METTPLRVIRHESSEWSWEFVSRDPHPRLRPLVRSYVGFRERCANPARRIESATDDIVLVISFGPRLRIIDPRDPRTVERPIGSFASGLYDSYVVTEMATESHGLEVKFSPLGARMFFGLPMSELANRTIDPADLWGTSVIVEELEDAPSWEARFRMLDTFIEQRLSRARPLSPLIALAVRHLNETVGEADIASLSARLGLSQKQLVAQFRDQVGLSPKRFARILRFKQVTSQLTYGREPRWTDLAHACGYYDQAHFNREFRAFTGHTPTEFFQRLQPDGGGILGH